MANNGTIGGAQFLIAEIPIEKIFTPEDFTDEHKMILETTKDFVNNEIHPKIEQIEAKDVDLIRSILKAAGELGLNSTDIPEEYGGVGLDKISTAVVTEAMGNAGSFAVSHGAHTGIGTLPIVFFGTDEQKKKYLPGLASGELFGAYCLTEPSAGSDALNARTKAVLSEDGSHYILNGEKLYITNAGWADLFIVYAKVDGDKFTAFIVEKGFEGVSTGAEEKKMGIKGSSTRSVILEDAKVPVENLLFEVGQGHKVAFNILNIGRYKLGAATIGGSKGALEGAVKYAKGRLQFNTPICQFGMIKTKLADMAIKTYMNESMVYRTAGLIDAKLHLLDDEARKQGAENAKAIQEYAIECSINKVYGSEALSFVVDEYVQILGGYGYCGEYPAERYYRDARINRIYEGTNEVNRLIVPGEIFKRALKGQLALMPIIQGLGAEIKAYDPENPQLNEGPLAAQENMVKMCKKMAIMSAGVAAQKFMQKLEKEQETLGMISDMVIEIFAMDSGLRRTMKLIEKEGEEKAKYNVAATQVYVNDAFPRVYNWAKQVITYVMEGDMLQKQLRGLNKIGTYQAVNTIPLRRMIADRVIEVESYPF